MASQTPPAGLVERLEAAFDQWADRPAIIDGEARLTFAELDRASSRLARVIVDRLGESPPQAVAALFPPSAEGLITLVAVLKSGHILLPLDVSLPPQRAQGILAEGGVRLLLARAAELDTAAALAGEAIAVVDVTEIAPDAPALERRRVPPEALCSVMFSSGTTGIPKGVMHTHANLLAGLERQPAFEPGNVRAECAASISYAMGINNPTAAWLTGGVALTFDLRALGPRAMADWIKRERVTALKLIVSPFRNLIAALHPDEVLDSVRTVRLVGEPMLQQDVDAFVRHFAPECVLQTSFGMTETFLMCVSDIDRDKDRHFPVMPVGMPAPGARLWLRDDDGREVAPGEVGELCVTSRTLSPGYWRAPDLTAQKFSADPTDPTLRTMRTGDLARFLPDGRVMIVGRKDSQIKIRGQRVMLSDVETAIRGLPNVRRAAVVTRLSPAGDARLVAYIVPERGPFDAASARRELATRLPAAMVPTAYVQLERLPTLVSGKADVQALPDPDWGRRQVSVPYAAAHTDAQRVLVDLWEQALGVHPIGIHDDFFDLGGESVMAAQVFSGIEARLGIEAPISTLVDAPTIALLADALTRPERAKTGAVPLQHAGARQPLFLVHALGGTVLNYLSFARGLGRDRPVYGLMARGVDGTEEPRATIEEMAADCVASIRQKQPHGPYLVGGHCLGGVVAFETARQLEALGETVSSVVLIDAWTPGAPARRDALKAPGRFLPNLARWARTYGPRYIGARVRQALRPTAGVSNGAASTQIEDIVAVPDHVAPELREIVFTQIRALRQYRPASIRAPVRLFRVALQPVFRAHQHDYGWASLTRGGVAVRVVAGTHRSVILSPEHARGLASAVTESLDGGASGRPG